MPKLNWDIILSNIAEAREQLEEIQTRVGEGESITEYDLQVMLEHAYHHLNFAWNVRRVPTKQYAKLSDEEFNQWSRFPPEIRAYGLSTENSDEPA